MYLFFAALAPAMQLPVISPYHPPAASELELRMQARCGSDIIEISGYGASRSPHATITINGSPVVGKRLGQLIADLSVRRAVYRLGPLCDRSARMLLYIHRGEAKPFPDVDYRLGVAVFQRGTLVKYDGLQAANAGAFWFR